MSSQFGSVINTADMMHLAVEASQNGMVMTNHEGRIVMVNVATEKLFGYSRQELIGNLVEMLIPRRYHQHHRDYRGDYVEELKSRPMGHGSDLYGLRKDGKEFPVEVGLNPIKTEQGIFVLAAIIDLTDRKQAEGMIHLAVEASPNGMIMADQNGIIVMVNSATEELFGYEREELIGERVEILIPEPHRSMHSGLRKEYVSHPATRSMGHGRDLYGLHKRGRKFPVEVGLNPIETKQGIMVLASVIDITERKYQEEQLKAAIKEKDLLLAEIHHRVKNNLQIIDSLLGMQSDMLPDCSVMSVLQESQNRVKSMALIHQILYESTDFSKVDFSNVLRSLVDTLSYSYALDTSKFSVNVITDLIFLPIDTSIPLGLIVNELCSNTMKYAFIGRESGNICISLKFFDADRLQLCVMDNGIGLPEALDMQQTATLGLQLVQLLSEQISAELSIQRRNPTCFTLILPCSN